MSMREERERLEQLEDEAAAKRREQVAAERAARKERAGAAIGEALALLAQAAPLLDDAAKKVQQIGGLGTEWATLVKLRAGLEAVQERMQERQSTGRFFVYDRTDTFNGTEK